MLHLLLKNRYLFLLCLGLIWIAIFLVPRLGYHYRTSNSLAHETVFEARYNHENKDTINDLQTPEYLLAGEFQQEGNCIDTLDGKPGSNIGVYKCHGAGRNQFWFLVKDKLWLQNKKLCVVGPTDFRTPGPAKLAPCLDDEENMAWFFEHRQLKMSGSNLCLEVKDRGQIHLDNCDQTKSKQSWKLNTPAGF